MTKYGIVDVLLWPAAFLLTTVVPGCQPTHSQLANLTSPSQSAVDSHQAHIARVQAVSAFPDTLAGAAHQTYAAHVRAINTGETDLSESIPALYWAERIKQPRPISVYTHGVNIAVVLEQFGNTQKGKYIYIPVSSYLPMTGDDGFVFEPNPNKGKTYQCHEVLDFTRTTSN